MRRLLAVAAMLLMQETLVETIEVRVVNVDVIVTDRAGNPIRGLTRDDFELFEDGKPQTITNFYEERQTPAVPPLPAERGEGARSAGEGSVATAQDPDRARRIVLFLDDYSIDARKRQQVLQSLEKFIDTEMRAGDSATIVSWARRTRVIAQFTSDKAALKASLKTLASSGVAIKSTTDDAMVRRRCMSAAAVSGRGRAQAAEDCLMEINARADEQWSLERDLLKAMRVTMSSLAGIEGKKVMVIAGSHLPEKPGLDLFQFFSQLFGGGGMRNPYMMAGHRSQTISIEDVARAANGDGVTLYLIDTADSRDSTSADVTEQITAEESFMKFSNTAIAYQSLARITGGVAVTNTTNFDTAFNAVARDLDSYYSLGYRPNEKLTAGNHKLVVKPKSFEYRVRFRQTYALKTADEQMSDRVLANIYHEGLKSEWPIVLRTGAPKKNGRNYDVPIELTIPASVTLLPAEGGKVAGGFDVYIAVGNEEGMSDVSKRPQSIRIPAAIEKVIRAKPLVFNAVVRMRPGKNTLSIAVIDQISNATGYARTTVDAR
jgi:VWFA-related protein